MASASNVHGTIYLTTATSLSSAMGSVTMTVRCLTVGGTAAIVPLLLRPVLWQVERAANHWVMVTATWPSTWQPVGATGAIVRTRTEASATRLSCAATARASSTLRCAMECPTVQGVQQKTRCGVPRTKSAPEYMCTCVQRPSGMRSSSKLMVGRCTVIQRVHAAKMSLATAKMEAASVLALSPGGTF